MQNDDEGNPTHPVTVRLRRPSKTFGEHYISLVRWHAAFSRMLGTLTLRILPYLLGVMAWLSGKADGPPKKVPLLVPEHLRVFIADEQRAEQRRRQQALEAAEKESLPGRPPP